MRTWRWLIVATAVLTAPAEVSGQVFPDANGASLKGVTTFDARVVLLIWNLENEEGFRQNAQSAFELALRRDGVVVSATSPHYLFCEVRALDRDGVVAYFAEVTYYTYNGLGVHRLQWTNGYLATVGRNNFTYESVTRTCADLFANEWLKWNPKR